MLLEIESKKEEVSEQSNLSMLTCFRRQKDKEEEKQERRRKH
jgi:hypothetical protein